VRSGSTKGGTVATRGEYDPVHCTGCGQRLDYTYDLAEFGVCEPCTRKLEDAFIAGFGLQAGEHFEKDTDGNITDWYGDAIFAGAAWMTICERRGAWADAPLDELVSLTKRFLWACHGPLPAPFGDPDDDELDT
jgi:hypothetical protein